MIDYSTCITDAPDSTADTDFAYMDSSKYNYYFKTATMPAELPQWKRNKYNATYAGGGSQMIWNCSIQFQIPDDIGPPVLFYYRLTNFYQNHRRYVKSLDSNQLAGQAESNDTINSGYCTPLSVDPVTKRPYYPCGLIANSQFNDSFSSPVLLNTVNSTSNSQEYFMTNQGIAWSSDAKLYGKTAYKAEEIAVPPNWVHQYPNGNYSDQHPPPNLATDEAFQVWMRTAGLPAFSKLALRNDTLAMTAGRYRVDVGLSKVVIIVTVVRD